MKLAFEDFKRDGEASYNAAGPDDLFITSASYEERCVLLAAALPNFNYKASQGLIYVHQEFLAAKDSKTAHNLESLRRSLWKCCDTVGVVEGSWLDPTKQLFALRAAIKAYLEKRSGAVSKQTKILLDVSTFTRETLILFVELLRTYVASAEIRILYSSPKNHGPWLSRGFRNVRNVLGFPGVQEGRKPTLLVVLSGFEPERTVRLIEEHEPRMVLLGLGDPPTSEDFRRRNKSEQRLVLARQEVQTFSFAADDLEQCAKEIEAIFAQYVGKFNVIIAPMSTKLSTLAALIACEKYREVQITYCVPGEYNTAEYSTGIDAIYTHVLPSTQEQLNLTT